MLDVLLNAMGGLVPEAADGDVGADASGSC